MREEKRGSAHWNWKPVMKGYRNVVAIEGPRKGQLVGEHVLVAEKAFGRMLPPEAEVHHVNENKGDNQNRNLVICQDGAYHKLLHARRRIVDAGGNPDTDRMCSRCGLQPRRSFTGRITYCRTCVSEVNRQRREAA